MKTFLKEWGTLLLIPIVCLLAWLFLFINVRVDGHSMDPTLSDRERLFVWRIAEIDRFDIVVAKEGDKNIVKRVIGMPGDTISFENDVLMINGQVVDEPYLDDYHEKFAKDRLQSTYSYNKLFQQLAAQSAAFTTGRNGETTFTVAVPEGEYYLLGDDRIVSKDSREVGTFKKESIIGEVKFRLWPLTAIGTVN